MTDRARDSSSASKHATGEANDVRRKLLRALALSGAGMTLGQIAYQAPAAKSFFGARSAWAQPTPALGCAVVPLNLTIDDTECNMSGTSATFNIANTGTVPFSIDALNLVTSDPPQSNVWQILSPTVFPVPLAPGANIDVDVNYRCCESMGGSAIVQIVTSSSLGPAPCTQVAVTGNCNSRG